MKIAFLGAGNMASAMIRGLVRSGQAAPDGIAVSASSAKSERLAALCSETGAVAKASNKEAAEGADIFVLAAKPQQYETLIADVRPVLKAGQIAVSIAPGKTIEWLSGQLGEGIKVVRAMPNTPALVGEGMTGYCCAAGLSDDDKEKVLSVLTSCGKAEEVPEALMDVVVSTSGSSPAYVFMLIEAMRDAAVSSGMPEEQAVRFAEQAVLGSAKLAIETGTDPAELRRRVCSPGGTTIEAVKVFEGRGLAEIVREAMAACEKRSREL